MKILGFTSESNEEKNINVNEIENGQTLDEAPVRSVVRVRFPQLNRELPYYNDRFNLKVGDVVYVDGSFSNSIGYVTSVTTHFKVDLEFYKRVLVKLDMSIHGKYKPVLSFMASDDEVAVSPEQFGSWEIPPRETEPEYFVGEGYEIDPCLISDSDITTDVIKQRGAEYVKDGNVKYISVRNGIGCVYIRGETTYRLDFRYENGIISDLLCDCMFPEFCKHEVALCFIFKLLTEKNIEIGKYFTAIDRTIFFHNLALNDSEITL